MAHSPAAGQEMALDLMSKLHVVLLANLPHKPATMKLEY